MRSGGGTPGGAGGWTVIPGGKLYDPNVSRKREKAKRVSWPSALFAAAVGSGLAVAGAWAIDTRMAESGPLPIPPGTDWRTLARFGALAWALLVLGASLHLIAQPKTERPYWASLPPCGLAALPVALLLLRAGHFVSIRGRLGSWPIPDWAPPLGAIGIAVVALVLTRLLVSLAAAMPQRFGIAATSIGATVLYLDSRLAPELYLHLHDAAYGIGLLLIAHGLACTLHSHLPHGWPHRKSLGGLIVTLTLFAAVIGIQLRTEWSSLPTSIRHYLSQELRGGASLTRVLAFPHQASDALTHQALSASGRRWMELEANARARVRLRPIFPQSPHIVVVSMDAVRADVCGFQSPKHPGTTPFLDRWSQSAIVFTNARAPTVTSYLSILSTLSGVSAATIQALEGQTPPTLATILAEHGYATKASLPREIFSARDATWSPDLPSFGFSERRELPRSEDFFAQTLQWLDLAGTTPQFIFGHLMDPHAPYDQRETSFGQGSFARYRSEVHHVDHEFEKFWGQLSARGLEDRVLLVVLADHGEAFREHGALFHGTNLHEPQLHVPWLIRAPGLAPARFETAAVTTTSLPRTLCDLLSLPPLSGLESPSLAPLLLGLSTGEELSALSDLPVPRQFAGLAEQRVLVRGRQKLLHNLRTGAHKLYDLAADPGESRDLFLEDPSLLPQWTLWLSEALHDRVARRNEANPMPVRLTHEDDAVLKANRGDLSAVPELLSRLESQDALARQNAADSLLDLWCREAANSYPNVLPAQSQDTHVSAAHHAIEVLTGSRPVDHRFLSTLGSRSIDRQKTMVWALLQHSDKVQALEAIHASLSDPRLLPVRPELGSLLALRGDHRVAPLLLAALENSTDRIQTTLVLKGLASLPDPDIFTKLVQLVNERLAGFRALFLAQLQPKIREDHRKWMTSLWADPSPEVRYFAALTLGGIDAAGRRHYDLIRLFDPDLDTRSRLSEVPSHTLFPIEDSLSAYRFAFLDTQPHVKIRLRGGVEYEPKSGVILRQGEGEILLAPPVDPKSRLIIHGSCKKNLRFRLEEAPLTVDHPPNSESTILLVLPLPATPAKGILRLCVEAPMSSASESAPRHPALQFTAIEWQ